MKKPQLNKEYRVIFGNIVIGRKPNGTSKYASVYKITDCMVLPSFLLTLIAEQVVHNPKISARRYLIPELFEGEIIYF